MLLSPASSNRLKGTVQNEKLLEIVSDLRSLHRFNYKEALKYNHLSLVQRLREEWRIMKYINWKKIAVCAAIIAVAIYAALATGCKSDSSDGTQTGQYASMEDFAQQTMNAAEAVTYYHANGNEAIADVLDTKLAWLEKHGELEDLAPDGTLEAWTFNYLVKVDTDAANVYLVGGMYEEDGYFDLEGQGGHNLVALRYPDGSYDIMYDQVVNDNMDFFGYHRNYEEAIYDWYVKENALELPLYVEDWSDRITIPEGCRLGNFPVHRFDGNGWYIYIPIDGWKQDETERKFSEGHRTWVWYSGYGTDSLMIVNQFTFPLKDEWTTAKKQGYTPLDDSKLVWDHYQDGDSSRYYLAERPGGGCWRVEIQWMDANITDSPDTAIEPEVLRLMAESFMPDDRITEAGLQERRLDVVATMQNANDFYYPPDQFEEENEANGKLNDDLHAAEQSEIRELAFPDAIPLSDSENSAVKGAILSNMQSGWWTAEPLSACDYHSAAFECLYRRETAGCLELYGYAWYSRWKQDSGGETLAQNEDFGTLAVVTLDTNINSITDFWIPGDGACYERDVLKKFPPEIAEVVAEPDPQRYQAVRERMLTACRQSPAKIETASIELSGNFSAGMTFDIASEEE